MMRKGRSNTNRQPSALDSGLYAGDSDLILLWNAVAARLPEYIHRKGSLSETPSIARGHYGHQFGKGAIDDFLKILVAVAISRYARDFRKDLLLNSIREFLNHWIGEHVFGDALHFSFGGVFVKSAIQVQFKELSLADGVHAFITHF